jgi:hypothetical protein
MLIKIRVVAAFVVEVCADENEAMRKGFGMLARSFSLMGFLVPPGVFTLGKITSHSTLVHFSLYVGLQ